MSLAHEKRQATKAARLRSKLLTQRNSRSTASEPGYRVVAHALKSSGIDHVFAVPGVPMYEPLKACLEHDIRVVGTRHQFTAAVAAAGHNYTAGAQRAAAMASAGPATTNLLTGLLYARVNGFPLVALGSRRGGHSTLAGEFQALDVVPGFESIVNWADRIESAAAVFSTIRSAIASAESNARGPVYLDVFEEALAERTPANVQGPPPGSGTSNNPDPQAIDRLIDLLRGARRPALIVGGVARWDEAPDAIRRFAEAAHCACITLPTARGIMPDSHPLVFNSMAQQVQSQADLVILAGADLDWQVRFGSMIPPATKVVMIGARSPETSANRPLELIVAGQLATTFDALASTLDGSQTASSETTTWHESLRNEATIAESQFRAKAMSAGDALTTERLLFEIRDLLPRDAVTIFDANIAMLAAQQIIPCELPGHRLTVGANGTIGVGIPLALGAKLAQPRSPVIALCGDFAIGFSCADFETAVRHKIPVTVIVVENGGISAGTIERGFFGNSPDPVASANPNVRFDRLGEALGGHGEYLETASKVRPALERAAQSSVPSMLHVRVAQ